MTLDKINEAANMWNETKDPQYKEVWYKLVKEFDGRTSTLYSSTTASIRRNSNQRSSGVHKTDDPDGMSGLWRCP